MFKDDEAIQVDEGRRLSAMERSLAVSPIEMRQRKFATAMRGFDRQEVMAFLVEAASAYESALRDNERLRQDVVKLEASLNQFRELEGSLKSTLMSAQKVADDMHENAVQESARVLRDAETRADLLLQKAQASLDGVQREIDNLRMKRRDTVTSLEATLSTLHGALDFIREQDRREREGATIIQHRPQVVQTA